MAVAKATKRYSQNTFPVRKQEISHARTVLEHAPDLADAVLAGGSLNDAYAIAQERKRAKEAAETEEATREAREKAEQQKRRIEEKRKWEAQEKAVREAIEMIGPEVPIREMPPKPAVSVIEGAEPIKALSAGMENWKYEQEVLQQLVMIRRQLDSIEPAEPTRLHELYRLAVHSGITHVIEAAVKVIERHDAAAQGTKIVKRVK